MKHSEQFFYETLFKFQYKIIKTLIGVNHSRNVMWIIFLRKSSTNYNSIRFRVKQIFFFKLKVSSCATVETNWKIEIYLRGWSLPTNVSPYAPTIDRTHDQMFKGLKYLPLVSHYVGNNVNLFNLSFNTINIKYYELVSKFILLF
jgi:hypothetical protein